MEQAGQQLNPIDQPRAGVVEEFSGDSVHPAVFYRA